MDTLTHALSGMLVARASYKTDENLPLWLRSWLGFCIAAFPDIDYISRAFGISTYLDYHRGVTHSVLLMPIWALLLSWLIATVLNRFTQIKLKWQELLPLCLLSIGVHIFADVITAYGTEIFAPFSDFRLSLPTTFIIDLYFSGIILVAILLSVFIRKNARRIALSGVIVLMCYVLLQGYWLRLALTEAYVSVPIDKLSVIQVVALPQPLSPFNWKLIIETDEKFYIRYINLYRSELKTAQKEDGMLTRINALYTPLRQRDWYLAPKLGIGPIQPLAREIWQADELESIRRFMLFPAVHRFDQLPDMQCVWFADQRFILSNIRAPFVFGACEHRQSKEKIFLRMVDGKPTPLY